MRGRSIAERLAPRLGRRAVDHQHAVEVVGLVLHAARAYAVELVAHVRRRSRPGRRCVTSSDRSTGTVMPWIERQPSSATSVSVAPLDDLGVHDRDDLVLVRLEDEERAAARRPASPRGRSRSRRASAASSARRGSRSSSSNSSTGRASIFSAASGYWRIWASAIRRRASRSGSSSSSLTCPSIARRVCHAVGTLPRMDPREAKEIMSQGAIRPETPRDRRSGACSRRSSRRARSRGSRCGSGCATSGPTPTPAIRALGGPTIWMRRLRAIEDELDRHEAQLGEAWRELAAEIADPDEFARRWRETARTWSFAQVNELIERHNRNFPAEARLPMDPRTRDFVKFNGRRTSGSRSTRSGSSTASRPTRPSRARLTGGCPTQTSPGVRHD